MDGFSGTKLLPTDRAAYSTADGLQERNKESLKLPSMAWQWESNWYLETSFNREKLDNHGWTYAVDFPAEYHSKKSFTSCVRRRKWIRYRRYIAMNTWSQISPIHKDPSEEPFIDVSIGGYDLPNGNPEEGLVWAVTVTTKEGSVASRESSFLRESWQENILNVSLLYYNYTNYIIS